jgi:alpha-tubulin suppressor-like RCC1 family protein
LRSRRTVWAWGLNGDGQLGDGTTLNRWLPVQVTGLDDIVAISAGGSHSLALRADGTVWAWGNNFYSQLGDGTLTDQYVPVQVPGLMGVTAIAAGGAHTLILKDDTTVWGWGNDKEGELGDGMGGGGGDVHYHRTPTQVVGLTGVPAICAGSQHSLALTFDGAVWA